MISPLHNIKETIYTTNTSYCQKYNITNKGFSAVIMVLLICSPHQVNICLSYRLFVYLYHSNDPINSRQFTGCMTIT